MDTYFVLNKAPHHDIASGFSCSCPAGFYRSLNASGQCVSCGLGGVSFVILYHHRSVDVHVTMQQIMHAYLTVHNALVRPRGHLCSD